MRFPSAIAVPATAPTAERAARQRDPRGQRFEAARAVQRVGQDWRRSVAIDVWSLSSTQARRAADAARPSSAMAVVPEQSCLPSVATLIRWVVDHVAGIRSGWDEAMAATLTAEAPDPRPRRRASRFRLAQAPERSCGKNPRQRRAISSRIESAGWDQRLTILMPCRAAIGWTACARRTVAADISDTPMCRTYPAFTSSAIAPTVSSIGTAGSSRAGWYRSM